MNYTLHQLTIFLKIVETKNITKAAEELNLTQPAVSIQLKNFQDQFEIPLTEIIGKQLFITDFGNDIASIAKEIFEKTEDIKNKTNSYKGLITGKLKIASVSTGKYVIPYFLSKFITENPGIELILDVTNKSKVIDSVEKNEVDFGFVSIIPDKPMVFNEELLLNKIFLVCNDDMYKNLRNLKLKDLENLPVIFREEGSGTRFKMERFFDVNKIKINKRLELTSNEAVKQAVIAGLGISIMPLIGIKNEILNGDLKIINLKQLPLITNWNLIWNSHKSLSPVAKAFLEHLKENKSLIIKSNFQWFNEF